MKRQEGSPRSGPPGPKGGSAVLRIERLPVDLEALVAASLAEGFAFLARLRDEWASGANRFDAPGEALFEARVGGALVGVCGLNRDPFARDPRLGRLRHLYVLPEARRDGVGARLVAACLQHGTGRFERVRLRTTSEVADRFYRSLGFERAAGEADATHSLTLARLD